MKQLYVPETLPDLNHIPKASVPASFLAAELAVVHTADGINTDYDPTLFTFKRNNLMGLNQGVEQR